MLCTCELYAQFFDSIVALELYVENTQAQSSFAVLVSPCCCELVGVYVSHLMCSLLQLMVCMLLLICTKIQSGTATCDNWTK